MAKLLKVLVVLLLVLSAVALFIEIRLFSQREELKGRNILLTRGAIQVAKTFEVVPPDTDLAVRDVPHYQPVEEMFKHFYLLGSDGKPVLENGKKKMDGPGTLDGALKEIAAKADLQYLRLNDTRLGLDNTRKTLGETSNTLVTTVQDLTTTKDTLKKTEGDLESTKQEVAKKVEQVADLSQKNETLSGEVEKKKEEVAKLTDKISDTEAKVEATKRYVEKLQKDLDACIRGTSDPNAVAPGLQGQVVVVNTNWNFVVVDILPDAKVIPMSELTIQRDAKLVGKVRVSAVLREQHFAFGEILPQWQQMPITKGDYAFY